MREILFRGKRTDGSGWIEGDLRRSDFAPISIKQRDVLVAEIEVIPETVGQYTGLKDRNGRRIFEGDILRPYDEDVGEFYGKACVVEYGKFNCSCCDGVYGWYFNEGDIRVCQRDYEGSCEIVGNLWDNPELLEVEP